MTEKAVSEETWKEWSRLGMMSDRPLPMPKGIYSKEASVDNQHKKIKGYRDLTESEIGYINSVKLHAEAVGMQIEQLEQLPGIDKYWLKIARTNLQTGFMAAVRAISKPTTF
jgi:hypothetical protein